MEAMTLSDLGPIIAAILGPMVAFVVVSMRYQHQDSTKTRELISNSEKATRDLIERSSNETREETTRQIERATDKLSAEFEKNHRTTQGQLGKITDSLADARERLAGIEGHLGIARRPRRDDQPGEEDSNAA